MKPSDGTDVDRYGRNDFVTRRPVRDIDVFPLACEMPKAKLLTCEKKVPICAAAESSQSRTVVDGTEFRD